jgi:hypothetical protein
MVVDLEIYFTLFPDITTSPHLARAQEEWRHQGQVVLRSLSKMSIVRFQVPIWSRG